MSDPTPAELIEEAKIMYHSAKFQENLITQLSYMYAAKDRLDKAGGEYVNLYQNENEQQARDNFNNKLRESTKKAAIYFYQEAQLHANYMTSSDLEIIGDYLSKPGMGYALLFPDKSEIEAKNFFKSELTKQYEKSALYHFEKAKGEGFYEAYTDIMLASDCVNKAGGDFSILYPGKSKEEAAKEFEKNANMHKVGMSVYNPEDMIKAVNPDATVTSVEFYCILGEELKSVLRKINLEEFSKYDKNICPRLFTDDSPGWER